MREPRVGLSEWLGRPGMLALGVVPFCKHRSRTARSVACSGKKPLPQPLCPVQRGVRGQWSKDQAPEQSSSFAGVTE